MTFVPIENVHGMYAGMHELCMFAVQRIYCICNNHFHCHGISSFSFLFFSFILSFHIHLSHSLARSLARSLALLFLLNSIQKPNTQPTIIIVAVDQIAFAKPFRCRCNGSLNRATEGNLNIFSGILIRQPN